MKKVILMIIVLITKMNAFTVFHYEDSGVASWFLEKLNSDEGIFYRIYESFFNAGSMIKIIVTMFIIMIFITLIKYFYSLIFLEKPNPNLEQIFEMFIWKELTNNIFTKILLGTFVMLIMLKPVPVINVKPIIKDVQIKCWDVSKYTHVQETGITGWSGTKEIMHVPLLLAIPIKYIEQFIYGFNIEEEENGDKIEYKINGKIIAEIQKIEPTTYGVSRQAYDSKAGNLTYIKKPFWPFYQIINITELTSTQINDNSCNILPSYVGLIGRSSRVISEAGLPIKKYYDLTTIQGDYANVAEKEKVINKYVQQINKIGKLKKINEKIENEKILTKSKKRTDEIIQAIEKEIEKSFHLIKKMDNIESKVSNGGNIPLMGTVRNIFIRNLYLPQFSETSDEMQNLAFLQTTNKLKIKGKIEITNNKMTWLEIEDGTENATVMQGLLAASTYNRIKHQEQINSTSTQAVKIANYKAFKDTIITTTNKRLQKYIGMEETNINKTNFFNNNTFGMYNLSGITVSGGVTSVENKSIEIAGIYNKAIFNDNINIPNITTTPDTTKAPIRLDFELYGTTKEKTDIENQIKMYVTSATNQLTFTNLTILDTTNIKYGNGRNEIDSIKNIFFTKLNEMIKDINIAEITSKTNILNAEKNIDILADLAVQMKDSQTLEQIDPKIKNHYKDTKIKDMLLYVNYKKYLMVREYINWILNESLTYLKEHNEAYEKKIISLPIEEIRELMKLWSEGQIGINDYWADIYNKTNIIFGTNGLKVPEEFTGKLFKKINYRETENCNKVNEYNTIEYVQYDCMPEEDLIINQKKKRFFIGDYSEEILRNDVHIFDSGLKIKDIKVRGRYNEDLVSTIPTITNSTSIKYFSKDIIKSNLINKLIKENYMANVGGWSTPTTGTTNIWNSQSVPGIIEMLNRSQIGVGNILLDKNININTQAVAKLEKKMLFTFINGIELKQINSTNYNLVMKEGNIIVEQLINRYENIIKQYTDNKIRVNGTDIKLINLDNLNLTRPDYYNLDEENREKLNKYTDVGIDEECKTEDCMGAGHNDVADIFYDSKLYKTIIEGLKNKKIKYDLLTTTGFGNTKASLLTALKKSKRCVFNSTETPGYYKCITQLYDNVDLKLNNLFANNIVGTNKISKTVTTSGTSTTLTNDDIAPEQFVKVLRMLITYEGNYSLMYNFKARLDGWGIDSFIHGIADKITEYYNQFGDTDYKRKYNVNIDSIEMLRVVVNSAAIFGENIENSILKIAKDIEINNNDLRSNKVDYVSIDRSWVNDGGLIISMLFATISILFLIMQLGIIIVSLLLAALAGVMSVFLITFTPIFIFLIKIVLSNYKEYYQNNGGSKLSDFIEHTETMLIKTTLATTLVYITLTLMIMLIDFFTEKALFANIISYLYSIEKEGRVTEIVFILNQIVIFITTIIILVIIRMLFKKLSTWLLETTVKSTFNQINQVSSMVTNSIKEMTTTIKK